MSLKWVDVQEIAIQLADSHPEVNPLTVSFPSYVVWSWPCLNSMTIRTVAGKRSWKRSRHCGSKSWIDVQ